MPTPPPVAASARYPLALRDFCTYINQPGGSDRYMYVPNAVGGGYTQIDLTLDAASVTKDLQTEILSMEKAIGARPFNVPTKTNLSGSVQWLYDNLAPGHVDHRNSVPPTPPPSHNHAHAASTARTADDHTQLMRVDGARAFTAPVTSPNATSNNNLVTLGQVRAAGYQTTAGVESLINTELHAASNDPITGPAPGRYKMTGGHFYGPTDGNGNAWISFGAGWHAVVSFVFMKMPFPGGSMLGWPAFQYMEDQLILQSLTPQGALIQFLEDIVVDRQALVSMVWILVGY